MSTAVRPLAHSDLWIALDMRLDFSLLSLLHLKSILALRHVQSAINVDFSSATHLFDQLMLIDFNLACGCQVLHSIRCL